MGDRDYFRKDYKFQTAAFQPGFDNATVSLIIFNLIVFTILFGLYLIYLVVYDTAIAADPAFAMDMHRNLNLPAEGSAFIRRPWTIVSYMFTHFGFWRLFSNMLWLWAFGYIFQTMSGNDRVVPVYLYSGVAAGAVFVVSSLFFDRGIAGEMTGAGAAVVGLAVAATAYSPDYRLFPMLGNGIPLWILTAIFLIIDISAISMSLNLLCAHLAAALAGYLFVVALKNGRDPGAWMSRLANSALNLFNPEKKYRGGEKETLFYKARKEPFVKKPNLTQSKLDEILDKINQRGYESLTEEEKEFLKKASEHL